MRRLMNRALSDMRAEGMPFCFLMPAAEEIYLPFGFTFIFDQPEWELPAMRMQDSAVAVRRLSSLDAEAVMEKTGQWMNSWLSKRYEVFARRDAEYVRRLLKEMESENGILEEIQEEGKTAGFSKRAHGDWKNRSSGCCWQNPPFTGKKTEESRLLWQGS